MMDIELFWSKKNNHALLSRCIIRLRRSSAVEFRDSLILILLSDGHRREANTVPKTVPFYSFLGAFKKLRKAATSCVMSVRLFAGNNSVPIGRFFFLW